MWSYILEFLFLISLCFILPFAKAKIDDINEHNNSHNELSFEIVGYSETFDKYGAPRYFKIVKYSDGCEFLQNINASEYFENKE